MRISWVWILVDNKKRILLLKRSDYTKSFPGYWTMPGGRWEKWESPEEVVIREVEEETGLLFVPTKIYMKSEVMNSWEEISSNRFLWSYSWEVKIQEDEADWYAWYTYEETKVLKIAFDYSDTIEELYKDWIIE